MMAVQQHLSLALHRTPCSRLYSRGCCTSQVPQELHPGPASHHRRVATVFIYQPSLLHERWVALGSHRTPCPRLYSRRRTSAVSVLPSFCRNITLPAPARHHRRVPTMLVHTAFTPAALAVDCGCSPPGSLCALRSRLVIPSSPSRARPCSNIIADEAEPESTFIALECL